MKVRYQKITLSPSSRAVVTTANKILAEYAKRGLVVTLRQLYYQFVARDLLRNKQSEYKRLGSIVNDARLAGLIDWDYLQDRTRNLSRLSHWDDPGDVIASAAQGYHKDLWETQPEYVEVWIEKDALLGVIEEVCEEWDVAFFSCRGYTSQSEMWAAAQRLRRKEDVGGKSTHIIHLGDHDPSGLDMTRDIQHRLRVFGSGVSVHRVALNMNQVRQYGPPPNPAKITDSRANAYIEKFGEESWELDALDPDLLIELIRSNIMEHCDVDEFDRATARQEAERELLSAASDRWDDIVPWLDSGA
jgi:hypothetical protein